MSTPPSVVPTVPTPNRAVSDPSTSLMGEASPQRMWRAMQGKIFEGICFSSMWVGLLVLLVLMVTLVLKAQGFRDWRSSSIAQLGLRPPVVDALAHAGLKTPREVDRYVADGKSLTDIPGISRSQVRQIDRALDSLKRNRPEGIGLDWQFLSSFTSYKPDEAGIAAGLWGSLLLILMTAFFAVPVGVGAALYLEEYAKGHWLTRLIQLNLTNLAGVPSIVYGLLGLTVFVRMFGYAQRPVATMLAGALTLALMVLPVVIVATQEALRSVPPSLRHASLALGATQWQTIWHQVLPAAVPGILTGVILSLSRAIGETAPLIVLGVPASLRYYPGGFERISDLLHNPSLILRAPGEQFTVLPMIIYTWVENSLDAFKENLAAAGILVLLALLLLLNGVAIYIRQRFQKQIRW